MLNELASPRGPRPFRGPALSLCLGLSLVAGGGCRDEPASPPSEAAPAPPPEAITVRADRPNLLFTYRDPSTGALSTVDAVEEVPEDARSAVVVVDLSMSPEARGAARYVQVADLRTPKPDGSYPVAVASRHTFDLASPPGSGGGTATTASDAPVIVYSASWCGVCTKAMRLLRELRVPFEEKDIEASQAALQELSEKAARAGLNPRGVPVIDVRGEILQGLDEPSLKASLRRAGLLEG